MPLVSPYNFGLDEEYLFSIPPFFYFFFKTIEGILFPPQPFTPRLASNSDRLRPASIDTCSPTEPQEISIYNDHRRTIDAWHAVIACLLIILLYPALRLSEDKWNMSSRQGRWSYRLELAKRDLYMNPRLNRASPPIMVPSYKDYRLTQRREAIRVLLKVMISACLCPITEYLFCTREAVSERWHNHAQGNSNEEVYGALEHGLFLIYLVLRYGILPWIVTAWVSMSIIISILDGRDSCEMAMSVWDLWIDGWLYERYGQLEKTLADMRYMRVMEDVDPGPPNREKDPRLYHHSPELVKRVLSERGKYQEFLSSEYLPGWTR